MTTTLPAGLDFGNQKTLDQSLSTMVRRLRGSAILKVAADVRAMIAAGKPVCNLTAGDFDPKQFPIPEALRDGIRNALQRGETNYPPSEGLPALRQAIVAYTDREQGVRYPIESVLVACGGRPIVYGAFRAVLNPGDQVVYGVPSWNNDYYADMTDAQPVEIECDRENGFQPTFAQVEPHLGTASLLCLCSPGNPTGTMMPASTLRQILEAVVAENESRKAANRRFLFVLFDAIYGSLAYGPAEHVNPLALVPEAAPYVIALDGISKAFAATGLRLGWALAAPTIITRMKDFLGHVGAWAPRAEQVGTAEFLADPVAVAEYRGSMHRAVKSRLDALYQGFTALKRAGFPVDCVEPQGAIYLSLRLDLVGHTVAGKPITTNEEIRLLLLEQAGLAVVPFQAFGLKGESGWFRMSVGSVSMADIDAAFPRVRQLLELVS
jgi:aspartate aminotransferase